MTRQAIADARELARAVSASKSHRPLSALAVAVSKLCDAVESLERDRDLVQALTYDIQDAAQQVLDRPRLPLDPKVWEVQAHASWGEAPDSRDGWLIVEPIGVVQADAQMPPYPALLWARKREGAK